MKQNRRLEYIRFEYSGDLNNPILETDQSFFDTLELYSEFKDFYLNSGTDKFEPSMTLKEKIIAALQLRIRRYESHEKRMKTFTLRISHYSNDLNRFKWKSQIMILISERTMGELWEEAQQADRLAQSPQWQFFYTAKEYTKKMNNEITNELINI